MPAISWSLSLSGLVSHQTNISSTSLGNALSNSTGDGLQVICAWPVSGQYGAGSRVLYYVLIAACVFARKAEWIKNACLAAALLLPAVAAVHAIVLAALHQEGAVDMDVYGCFQFCVIGILAAPVTVRLSQTYFNTPGRNTIFLWAGLILAGLLSLVVEFYRIQTFPCTQDGRGNPVNSDISQFPYNDTTTCGLVCSVDDGPFSPMRGGSANNIYVVPAPDKLTFGAATLLSAACCVHALVWMVSMAGKVLELNWKPVSGSEGDDLQNDEPISGTNGATKGNMKGVNNKIRFFLSMAAIPVFGGAGFAILIVGERNFFSKQVRYQNEPMASIGQWSPIVGTGLAALGSLYLLLAAEVEHEKGRLDPDAVHDCKCSHRHVDHHNSHVSRASSSLDSPSMGSGFIAESPEMMETPVMRPTTTGLSTIPSYSLEPARTIRPNLSNEPTTAVHQHISSGNSHGRQAVADSGSRKRVAQMFIAVGDTLGAKTQDWFDDSDFKVGLAGDFPEIPGEENRNSKLPFIRDKYNPQRDADGNVTPLMRSHSRAGSFGGSIASRQGVEGISPLVRATSPKPSASPFHSEPEANQRSNTVPLGRPSSELHKVDSEATEDRGRRLHRKDTLEVPIPAHLNPLRIHYSESSSPQVVMSGGRSSPPSLVNENDVAFSLPPRITSSPLLSSPGVITPPAMDDKSSK